MLNDEYYAILSSLTACCSKRCVSTVNVTVWISHKELACNTIIYIKLPYGSLNGKYIYIFILFQSEYLMSTNCTSVYLYSFSVSREPPQSHRIFSILICIKLYNVHVNSVKYVALYRDSSFLTMYHFFLNAEWAKIVRVWYEFCALPYQCHLIKGNIKCITELCQGFFFSNSQIT